jgi:hypothetical protein
MRKAGVGARRRHPVMRAKRFFDVPPGIPSGGGIRAGIPGEGGDCSGWRRADESVVCYTGRCMRDWATF